MREASNKGSLKTWRWWLYERRPEGVSSTRSSSFDGSFSNERSYHPNPRSSSSLLDEVREALIASPSYQSSSKKEQDKYKTSEVGVERSIVKPTDQKKNLYQSHFLKESLRLKVLRSLKNEAEDDLCDLVSRKTSMSRRTSVSGSPLPKIMPSISAGTEYEEFMRLVENIDNPPKDSDCGYTCVAWSSGQGRGISSPELISKHLSADLKKDKKMFERIEGRNIDEDFRNNQAGKSAEVAGWLKMALFGYAIANHLRRPLYYFSLDSMHTYLPTSSSYSGYPPFYMAFVNSNHYVVLHFKIVNGSIPALPMDGWWLKKSSSRCKNLWLQSLGKDLKLFQKLIPSASGGTVINLN
ncbi:hypothetical protein BY996DRAFT_8468956 [Phakopsora pachyrhizi]|nr:hypothetical protein BY996DRAFT_8468956 [Phakopsora pachyrhizi]